MKTERRHELATNDLADWLGDKIEELKPYSTAIWGTILAVVAVIFAFIYWSRNSEARLERTWDSYFNASRENAPEDLKSVAETYPEAPAGLWARLTLADMRLTSGVDALFNDHQASQEALKEAIEAYEFVIKHAPSDSLLVERATFGLGEAYESQNELDKARTQYETVEKNWPGGAFSTQAKQRLNDLNKPATKQFYDWFAKQEPRKKPATGSGLSLPTGDKPAFDASKLEEHPFQPQIQLDSNTFGNSLKTKQAPAEEDAAEESAADSDASGSQKPGSKSAEPEEPANEQPAGDESSDDQPGEKAE